jgi:hypothetical protein
MRLRPWTLLAWSLWGIIVAASVVGVILAYITSDSDDPVADLALATLFALFPTVGALVASRRPGDAIGWLYVGVGLTPVGAFSQHYAVYSLLMAPSPLPATALMAWFGSWATNLGWAMAFTFTLLLFPTGRLLSRRWRPFAWLATAFLVLVSVPRAFVTGPLQPIPSISRFPTIDNPVGLLAPLPDLRESLLIGFLFQVLFGAIVLGCAASAVLRFRRAKGLERQQLKWFASAVVLLLAGALAQSALEGLFPSARLIGNMLFVVGAAAIPVSVGVAILRYRLYEIDVLINRTLVYGATSGGIAIVFFAGIVVLQALLRPVTNGSELAVAASTLASFALFQPIRRRVQEAVDRRFDRSRYDAGRTLELFADRLRDEVDLDTLHADLIGVVWQTMSPAHASLWLREVERP